MPTHGESETSSTASHSSGRIMHIGGYRAHRPTGATAPQGRRDGTDARSRAAHRGAQGARGHGKGRRRIVTSHAALARVVVDTLRDAIGEEPKSAQIRKVMDLLSGVHGELAAYAGRADAATPVCASRRAAWSALSPDAQSALVGRDVERGVCPTINAMRLPCACGAEEHEPCWKRATASNLSPHDKIDAAIRAEQSLAVRVLNALSCQDPGWPNRQESRFDYADATCEEVARAFDCRRLLRRHNCGRKTLEALLASLSIRGLALKCGCRTGVRCAMRNGYVPIEEPEK